MPPKTPLPSETLDLNLWAISIILGCGILIWYAVVKWLPKKKKPGKEVTYDFEEWDGYHEIKKVIHKVK